MVTIEVNKGLALPELSEMTVELWLRPVVSRGQKGVEFSMPLCPTDWMLNIT